MAWLTVEQQATELTRRLRDLEERVECQRRWAAIHASQDTDGVTLRAQIDENEHLRVCIETVQQAMQTLKTDPKPRWM